VCKIPFGFPVVPEVYITYNGCSASKTHTHAQSTHSDHVVPPHVLLGALDVLAGTPYHQDVLDRPGCSASTFATASSTAGFNAEGRQRR